MLTDTYSEWCAKNNCQHGHCPYECEHPQPVLLANGKFVCGRCLYLCHEENEMIPCTPEVCE